MVQHRSAGVPEFDALFPYGVPNEFFAAPVFVTGLAKNTVTLVEQPGGNPNNKFEVQFASTADADQAARRLGNLVEQHIRDAAHEVYNTVGNRLMEMVDLHAAAAVSDPAGPHADFCRELEALKCRLLMASHVASGCMPQEEARQLVAKRDAELGIRADQLAGGGDGPAAGEQALRPVWLPAVKGRDCHIGLAPVAACLSYNGPEDYTEPLYYWDKDRCGFTLLAVPVKRSEPAPTFRMEFDTPAEARAGWRKFDQMLGTFLRGFAHSLLANAAMRVGDLRDLHAIPADEDPAGREAAFAAELSALTNRFRAAALVAYGTRSPEQAAREVADSDAALGIPEDRVCKYRIGYATRADVEAASYGSL